MKRFVHLWLILVLLAAVALPAVAGNGNPGNQLAGTWEVHVDAGFVQFTEFSSMI